MFDMLSERVLAQPKGERYAYAAFPSPLMQSGAHFTPIREVASTARPLFCRSTRRIGYKAAAGRRRAHKNHFYDSVSRGARRSPHGVVAHRPGEKAGDEFEHAGEYVEDGRERWQRAGKHQQPQCRHLILFRRAAKLLSMGAVNVKPLIAHAVPMEDFQRALELATPGTYRVVVTMD
jgi:hypothetical protein